MTTEAHNALVLIAQFCAEYVATLDGRPATQGAVKLQIQAALKQIERGLPIPEAPPDASPVGNAV